MEGRGPGRDASGRHGWDGAFVAPMDGRPLPGRRHDKACRLGLEIAATRLGLGVTIAALTGLLLRSVGPEMDAIVRGDLVQAVPAVTLTAILCFLIYGNLVYQACRLGYLHRRRHHDPASREELDELLLRSDRPMVILVPSYREEPDVVCQTLLSAALQEYPGKRVVLLIDDPPHPTDARAQALLEAARALPSQLAALLAEPATHARRLLEAYERRAPALFTGDATASRARLRAEVLRCCDAHRSAARWLEELAARAPSATHTDRCFTEQVLKGTARALRESARRHLEQAGVATPEALWLGYRRILATFEVELSAFERKAFVNLSHEPNKAMNLNSYLGLLGGSWCRVERPDGTHLVPASGGRVDLEVPAASYVATLDADSLLLPSYCLRLVQVLEQPGHERVAVAQTPYSAVPDAPSSLERIAGATTDVQYILHQGFTRHGATFWVGANAIIRADALEDLRTEVEERGFPVQRFIQDRTVIEDTESSIDLLDAGWTLFNYPERLSYSATPPDFGSLVVQRRRWANGGLLILPRLAAHLWRRGLRGLGPEGWMRLHYLTSIAGVNLGLLLLLSLPFTPPTAGFWIPVAAIPYFVLYARDLRLSGYRYRDVVSVYALNLLLLPVNLAGVAMSIRQGLRREKIPFGRTPKVQGRTRTPARYAMAPLALLAYWSVDAAFDAITRHWLNLGYEGVNILLLAFAVARFIGLRPLASDLRPGPATAEPKPAAPRPIPPIHAAHPPALARSASAFATTRAASSPSTKRCTLPVAETGKDSRNT